MPCLKKVKTNLKERLLSQSNDWQELADKLFLNTVTRLPVTLVRGEGTWAWDDRGKQFLDFVGGWAVDSLGHCHPALVNALEEQAKTLIQASNQFYTMQ